MPVCRFAHAALAKALEPELAQQLAMALEALTDG
jgi:hypothetical protein